MKKNPHFFAAGFMLFSLIFLGVSIVGIKAFLEKPKEALKTNVTNFNLAKINRIKKKHDTNKVKKKRQKMKKRMKALKPVLSAGLAGQSFGMDLSSLGDLGLDNELLGGDEDVIMDENSVDSKPRVLSRPPMEFPEKAIADNVMQGSVEVRMLIDKEGRVTNTEILAAKPLGYFEEATLAMLQGWRFEPATYRGRNVAIWAKQVIRYGN